MCGTAVRVGGVSVREILAQVAAGGVRVSLKEESDAASS